MRKRLLLLLLLLPLLVGCTGQGDAVPYEAEHRHVYGFWYEAEDGTEVRYCKICHATETQ